MELKQLILNRPAWLSPRSSNERVILSSQVSLSRNLESYPFPQRASLMEKERIFDEVTKIVDEKSLLGDEHLLVNLQEISAIGKTLLYERDFIELTDVQGDGFRGVAASEDGVAVIVNGKNHIQILCNSSETDLEPIWKKLDEIDTVLGKEFTYAYDEKHGFLLSQTEDSGTGLTASFTMHLPALQLTNTLEQVLTGAAQLGLSSEGKFRQDTESWGALFTLTAGVHTADTEKEILQNCFDAAEEVVRQELAARNKLFEEAKIEMEDKIWRSLGILQNARLLSIPQLLNLTSAIRLGIERGILIDILTIDNLNGTIASALQGSVAILMNDEKANEDKLDFKRAEIVRTLLSD
jgi:protein arginine kinase